MRYRRGLTLEEHLALAEELERLHHRLTDLSLKLGRLYGPRLAYRGHRLVEALCRLCGDLAVRLFQEHPEHARFYPAPDHCGAEGAPIGEDSLARPRVAALLGRSRH